MDLAMLSGGAGAVAEVFREAEPLPGPAGLNDFRGAPVGVLEAKIGPASHDIISCGCRGYVWQRPRAKLSVFIGSDRRILTWHFRGSEYAWRGLLKALA